MRCPKCGTQVEKDGSKTGQIITCPGCGTRLRMRDMPPQLRELLHEIGQTFPDRIVDMSGWNHERWDERIAYFCAKQGYANIGAFLQAYGFQVLFDGQQKPKPRKKKTGAKIAAIVIITVLVCFLAVAAVCMHYLTESDEQVPAQAEAAASASGGSPAVASAEGQSLTDVPNDEKYSRVFAAYEDACSMGAEAYRDWASDQNGRESFYPNCVEAIAYGYYMDDCPMYYAYFDLNEDGTDELFIAQYAGQTVTLLDAYTYHNGQEVKLFPEVSLGSRAQLYVTQDRELLINGSSGADNPTAEYYTLSQDTCRLTLICGFCSYEHSRDYPDYTPVDVSRWDDYVDTSGIQSEFSWNRFTFG